ncbi:MAG: hypothetical protein ACRDF4_07955 [Rhabdochlamydiaceae bacterium]
MNRILVIIVGVLGIVGVIVEVAVDLDNVYDMTITALFVLIVIFAFLGAFIGGQLPTRRVPSEEAKTNLK